MQKHLVFMLLLLSTPLLGQQTPTSALNQSPTADPGAFADVVAQVTSALNEYQANLGSGKDALPPLSSAEFDFKTTTSTKEGFSLQILVFKFGTNHEKDVVNDVTFTYALAKHVPPPKLSTKGVSLPPPQLKDQLTQTIQSAAESVKNARSLAGLPFSKLTINLQFSVDWNVNANGQVTYSFVTVGLSGAKDKNTVQSVKLVFEQ
jgi:hypothetical protein